MYTQPAKLDLNKKSLPKQKTIQNFTIDQGSLLGLILTRVYFKIDAQWFRKTKN